MSTFLFLSKSVVRSDLWKLVYTINNNIILVSDKTVMMGSLSDFFNGSLNDYGPFDDLIVTAAFNYKENSLILALNDSTIWCLSVNSRKAIGNFECPHLICMDHFSRAMVIASIHGLMSWWNWNQGTDALKVIDFKENGVLLNATFVHSVEYNLIYWAAAIIRREQLWIVIYKLDVFESPSYVELAGKKCVGDYHPCHLISLSSIPGVMALITDSNHLFIISVNDFKTGVGWKKVEIPVHTGSIISDLIIAPTGDKSDVQKTQYGFISTDLGQLLKVKIDGSGSKFKVEFRQLNESHPILMMCYLKRVNDFDLLALFGDLCDGSVVKVGTNNMSTLKRLENSSPALDSVLVPDEMSSKLVLSCGAKNGRLIEYRAGIPAVSIASSTGFEGVTGMWSLKKSETDAHHSILIISFIEQTRILFFKDYIFEDISHSLGLINNCSTIYACTFSFNSQTYYCQITNYYVLILGNVNGIKWESDNKIISAVTDEECIFLHTIKGEIVLLRVIEDTSGDQKLIEINRMKPEFDISCFSVLAISNRIKFLVLGLFNSSLYFIKIQEDQSLLKLGEYIFCTQDLDKKSSIPNSLIEIRNHSGDWALFVGLRNGTLLYLRLDTDRIAKGPNFLSLCISISQSTSLGSAPVSIMNTGLQNSVIAFSDLSAWIGVKDNSFDAKSITLNQIEYGTAFFFEDDSQPTYMIVSNHKLHCMKLLIGESYSIKSFPQVDTPRRIIYDHILDKYIVATTRYQDSVIYSEVKLLSSTSVRVLCTFSLSENETINSLTKWEARGKMYITLGTGGFYDQNFSDTFGRVIVLGIKLKQANEYKFKKLGEIVLNEKSVSCIRAIQTNYLLVGAGKTLYRLKIEKNQETDERKLNIAETTTVQWTIDCMDSFPVPGGEMIAIGCQRESISLYKFSASSKKLTFLASDRHSRLPSAVKIITETFIIGGDKLGNIFGLEYIKKNVPLERSLECCLSYKANEPIVKLFSGDFMHYFRMKNSAESLLLDSRTDDESDIMSLNSCHLTESINIYALGITGAVFELQSLNATLYQILFQLEGLLRKHLNLKRSMQESVIDSEVLKEFLSLELSEQSFLVSKWNERYSISGKTITASAVAACIDTLTA